MASDFPGTYKVEVASGAENGFFQRWSGLNASVNGADVVLSALLPEERAEEFSARILDVSAGTIEVLEAGERFQDVPWRAAKEE